MAKNISLLLRALVATPIFLLSASALDLIRFKIPEENQLNKGVGIVRPTAPTAHKRGSAMRIEFPSGIIEPSCRILINDSTTCLSATEIDAISNKTVRIKWSDQPIFFYKSELRLFEIKTEESDVLKYSKMAEYYKRKKRDIPSTIISVASFIFACGLISKRRWL